MTSLSNEETGASRRDDPPAFDAIDVIELALHKLLEREFVTRDEVMFAVEDATADLRKSGEIQNTERLHKLLNGVNSAYTWSQSPRG